MDTPLQSLTGLSHSEAEKLQLQFGKNTLSEKNTKNIVFEFIKKVFTPVSVTLIVSAFFASLFGEIRDGIIILAMVLLSAVLDTFQEYRSNKAAEKLSEQLVRDCTVIRNRQKQKILVSEVVPQDILYITIGDIIPADARIISSDTFSTNESVLTGESFPQEKQTNDDIFAGTHVSGGWAYAEVTKTGKNTNIGQLQHELNDSKSGNAYEKGIAGFSLLIFRATLLILVSVLTINITKSIVLDGGLSQAKLFELVLFSITIAVGLTPELLPVVMSINLTRGAIKMNHQGVLVKRLDAIPDFGSMDILCTDKTGTLTEDHITLIKHIDMNGEESEAVFNYSYLNSFFQSGLSNPLDDAILAHQKSNASNYIKYDELPYDFERRRLSVYIHDTNKNQNIIITKGQTEGIMRICNRYQQDTAIFDLDSNHRAIIQKRYEDINNQGFRVIALAYNTVIDSQTITAESEQNLILIGLLAFLDPPKLSASKTIATLAQYNVDLKIITGDNELVTHNICNTLNITITGTITGDQFSSLNSDQKKSIVQTCNIFARFTPSLKKEVIELLKTTGHVVGYLGDGINDALSLKAADVGISVDNAVDVARESADIILLNKNLENLLQGIIEGRKTFGNTLKYMQMAVSSNFGNMFSMVGAAIFLPFLPMLPVQVLLNNSLYDLSQIAIPTDNVDDELLQKPQQWDLESVRRFMFVFGALSSVFDYVTFFVMYKVFNLNPESFQTAWFLESIATQVLVIYIIRTRKLPFLQSNPSRLLILNTLLVLVTAIVIPFTFLGASFGLITLSVPILVGIAIIVITYLAVIEIAKRWFYKKQLQ